MNTHTTPHVAAVPRPSPARIGSPPPSVPGAAVTVVAVKIEEYQLAPYAARIEIRGVTAAEALTRLNEGYRLARAQLEAIL